MSDATERHVAAAAERVGCYRWLICGLLFAATAINYVDRQMIGILKPTLQADLGWSETDYANIVLWFQAAYAIGYLGFGRLVDRIGARMGYAVAFTLWTVAHILHGAVRTTFGFGAVRFMLGIGESGSFPAGLKAVATWFPARERALAIGIFNAGANVGAIVTPIIVPIITVAYGWRAAFVITGVLSFVWLFAWLAFYRTPRETKRLGAAELALIESDAPDAPGKVAWLRLLRYRETWAFALGKFITDPIWWMFLFWLPDFLAKRYDLDLMSFGPPLIAIYLLSDVGSVAGGWASSRLIARGHSVNRARKATMLVCALAVTPIFFAQWVSHLWIAVLIIGLAAAAHQAWSANLFTLVSDMFPRKAVGSVIGIGGTAGALGGMLMAKFAGYVLETVGTYRLIFFVAGSVYLIALAVIHLLSPRLARASVEIVEA
ncbi:ACS family hexuronate transporter-like MFS transporter [Hephaestia caeni]|uniref:ACS family hexuronate transporter-like MFS transporter n=1 Tax=Hephaestia caeni TaxID=645617 RepID=A0A397NK47_9SPHN|nr:MFS transporter [Hephaestia caeni]RIA37930.1 ACS family hexuronate transporter-like MFS transporter [Hephaestia caeni]